MKISSFQDTSLRAFLLPSFRINDSIILTEEKIMESSMREMIGEMILNNAHDSSDE